MKPSQVLKSKLEKIEYETISEKRLRGNKNNIRDKMKNLVGHTLTYPQIDQLLSLFQSEMEKNIGQLRQWLNEDRITEPKKMVTNEEIKTWLNLLNTIEEGE